MVLVTRVIIQYVIYNTYLWKTYCSVMEGSSQDYICKSDFLKKVVSCLPNRQWVHQQALMDGGADDNLSFLEHSGANQMHSCGYILKLHVMKVLVMLENIHGFTLSQAQMQSCLCVSGAITCMWGEVELSLATHVICACQRTTASFGKMRFFCVPTENTTGLSGSNHWDGIFLAWWFHFSACPFGGGKSSFKHLIWI